jgi:hypothetical protein
MSQSIVPLKPETAPRARGPDTAGERGVATERSSWQSMSHPVLIVDPMSSGWLEEDEFEPVGMLYITTERSVWFVTAERYQRIPRDEQPRPPAESIEDRLADGQWHGLRRCWWWVHPNGDRQMRLLPAKGPADGIGIVSGAVVAVKGTWLPVVTAAADSVDAPPSDP